jgi:hypothetical protein
MGKEHILERELAYIDVLVDSLQGGHRLPERRSAFVNGLKDFLTAEEGTSFWEYRRENDIWRRAPKSPWKVVEYEDINAAHTGAISIWVRADHVQSPYRIDINTEKVNSFIYMTARSFYYQERPIDTVNPERTQEVALLDDKMMSSNFGVCEKRDSRRVQSDTI